MTKPSSEKVIQDLRWVTQKQYGAEDKIRIVLDGLCGEESIAALCRREGIFPLGEFSPLQSSALAPNILLIPGTSSVAHLRENLSVAELDRPDEAIAAPDGRR